MPQIQWKVYLRVISVAVKGEQEMVKANKIVAKMEPWSTTQVIGAVVEVKLPILTEKDLSVK